ncbi:UPF0158 family protein [Flavivirga amylovorans]|uniref:UPF0158 family protein n=1 Tax=Flavivirga amylovorans TaxID=870486 RepID=A0ABT8WZ15_9FLAO|nr:UPF0158 family protein [Flavivirga amylovorans]MDO5986926.1 UPF0158 family protein [Flavivirga amylovorans]
MDNENQVLNWLMIGISQSPFSLNEVFYLDKKINEFFSILATDYFMLDDNFNLAKNTSTSYSKKNENDLINRIQRIENNDNQIIEVPRLSFNERKKILIEFLDSVNDENEKERIKNLYLNTDRTIFNRKFEIESNKDIIKNWNKYKNEILLSKAESFLNLNNININSTKVWEIEDDGNITIDLTKDDKGKSLGSTYKKIWWKFWK